MELALCKAEEILVTFSASMEVVEDSLPDATRLVDRHCRALVRASSRPRAQVRTPIVSWIS